jgi:hypothetical protein
MSDRPESLVLGNGEQLALLEVDDAGLPQEAYAMAEASGRFTGDRIFSTNPRLYRAIVALLGRSVPYREISEICGVSVNTVCGVSQREGVPIETIRERIGRLAMDVSAMTAEAMRDMLADPIQRARLSFKDLAIAHGIATQNGQLLLGGATSRMETHEAPPTHEDYLRSLRNVTPAATGLSSDSAPQKELVELPAGESAPIPETQTN